MEGVYLMSKAFLKFLFGTCQSLLNIHLVNTLDLTMQLYKNEQLLQNKLQDEFVKW